MRLTKLGMAAVLMAGATAAAQPPGGRGGMLQRPGGGGPAGLLSSKTVLADIKATEEQVAKLKEWGRDFVMKQMSGMRERFQDLQGLGREEMGKKLAEMQAETSKKAYAELADVLKPEQVERLKQIEVQVGIPQSFRMPSVQEALKLTDDQKDKLKDVVESFVNDERELREEMGLGGRPGQGGGRPDPAKAAEFAKKRGGMLKEMMGKVEAALTAEQKDAWKKLTGDPVDASKIEQEQREAMIANFRKKKDD
jgi:Spy/CpxP family protein refolding chaperone